VAQDRDEYFKYLAVQSVEIFCTFPVRDIGQVALIDLPGLGELRVGNEERMLRTLAEDVDLILFVRMAKQDGTGEQWDQLDLHLYETAQRAMPHLPLERWAFMLLNRTRTAQGGDINLGLSHHLGSTLEQTRIRVREYGIIDCASSRESGAFLDRMLDYLQDHILDIDTEYLNRRQESLRATHRRIAEQLQTALAALERSNEDNREGEQFRERFRSTYREVCHGLENVVRALRTARDREDVEFRTKIDATISACQSEPHLPALEEIQKLRDRLGSWAAAYDLTLGDMRARLRRKLFVLDDALQSSLDHSKWDVARVFRDTGSLQGLVPGEGTEFLLGLAPLLPSDLRPGFEILGRFQLSYRGFHYRLRNHLDQLQPDETEVNAPKPANGEEAQRRLKELHQHAVREIDKTLKGLLTEPSQVAYALVDEFLDLVIRTSEAEHLWTGFYEANREAIWRDIFGRIKETQQVLDRTEASLRQAIAVNGCDSGS
jgi:hypothetical protein